MELTQIIKSIQNFSILYAEDEESVRTSMMYILKRFSNDITAVTNGLEAWEAYQQRPYTIVITDLQMPRMNGAQLIEQIHTLSKDQIIIVISAFHENSEFQDILTSDTVHLLTKPLVLSEFLATLQDLVLNKAKQG